MLQGHSLPSRNTYRLALISREGQRHILWLCVNIQVCTCTRERYPPNLLTMNAGIDPSFEKDSLTEHDDTDPSNIGLSLTIREIAERLVISEEAARALVKSSYHGTEPPPLPDRLIRSD